MYDYVKQYLGDSRETREFAREFIEKRKMQREKAPVSVSNFPQVSLNQVRTAERRTRTFKAFYLIRRILRSIFRGNFFCCPHLCTLGTRGFSRVRWEFSVLAEGRHIRARKVSGTHGNIYATRVCVWKQVKAEQTVTNGPSLLNNPSPLLKSD